VAVAGLLGCGATAHVGHSTPSAALAVRNPASTRPAASNPHGCVASLRAALTAPAGPRAGSAGTAPQAFALFRRVAGTADRLPTTRGVGAFVEPQLNSYDPSFTRRIFDPPVPRGRPALSAYVVVGQGFGSELTDEHFPCVRHLPARQRRETERGLAQGRATVPVGPAFCFEAFSTLHGKTVGGTAGFCDTFAHAANGYGANEITVVSNQPERASIVPDGIATIVLHYQGRPAITAPVHDNVYWVAVPDYVPYAQGPPLSQPAAIRRAILHSLPTSIQWLAPDGHALRTFTPPPAYVNYLIAVYDSCQRANCGA
jgi:hypothetical protein